MSAAISDIGRSLLQRVRDWLEYIHERRTRPRCPYGHWYVDRSSRPRAVHDRRKSYWGYAVGWMPDEGLPLRNIHGHGGQHEIEPGDTLILTVGAYRVVHFERVPDPPDMWFAKVEAA